MIDQCCGSGMFIPDPDFLPSQNRISDSTRTKKRRWINFLSYLFCSLKILQNWKLFFSEKVQKIFEPVYKEVFLSLTQTIVTNLSEIKYGFGIRDPEKNSSLIPDPGIKKHRRSGSATLQIDYYNWDCLLNYALRKKCKLRLYGNKNKCIPSTGWWPPSS